MRPSHRKLMIRLGLPGRGSTSSVIHSGASAVPVSISPIIIAANATPAPTSDLIREDAPVYLLRKAPLGDQVVVQQRAVFGAEGGVVDDLLANGNAASGIKRKKHFI